MKTESGADNVTLQTTGLGKNNISISTALAAWTEFQETVSYFGRQKEAVVEVMFENNPEGTCAWLDDLRIVCTGKYHEKTYDGIPPLRCVK